MKRETHSFLSTTAKMGLIQTITRRRLGSKCISPQKAIMISICSRPWSKNVTGHSLTHRVLDGSCGSSFRPKFQAIAAKSSEVQRLLQFAFGTYDFNACVFSASGV